MIGRTGARAGSQKRGTVHTHAAAAPSLDLRSLEARLTELRELHDQGSISEREHHAARAAAIAGD